MPFEFLVHFASRAAEARHSFRTCIAFLSCILAPAGGLSLLQAQAPPPASYSHIPQVANGEIENGSFRTTFVLTNTSAATTEAEINLTLDDGSPLEMTLSEGEKDLGTGSSFTILVAGGGVRFIQSDGLGPVSVGAALIRRSSDALTVAAVFSIVDSDGQLLTEAGVGDSPPLEAFVLPVDTTQSFNTGLALFNPDPGQASQVTLQLYDLAGSSPKPATQASLPALGHLAQFVDEFFAGLGDFRGTLHVTATRPVAAMTLRQNNAPLAFTTLPVFSAASTQIEFNLPHVADGSFPGGRIRTTFLLFALSEQSASARFTLTQDGGTALKMSLSGPGEISETDLSIAPNGMLFLESAATGTLGSGAARVVSDKPIGVAAIFSILDTSGAFRTETGVAASPSFSDLSLPVNTTASFDSGIAFFNPNDSAVSVTLALLDSEGQPAVSAQPGGGTVPVPHANLELPARGHLARFASELFSTQRADLRGSVGVLASSNISAITLRQNSAPLSLTTLPVADGAAAPMRGDGLVLNEVGFTPPAGQFPYLELKATQEGVLPAGLFLFNEAEGEYRLPAGLPALAKGDLLLIKFDGQNRIEGSTVHASSTGFLSPTSGFLLLMNYNGQEIDHIGWGPGQLQTVRLGRGGAFDDVPAAGLSIGRVPSSDRPTRFEDWVSYSPGQATPGQPNLWPRAEALLPGPGGVFEESVVSLTWYPVPGAVSYRVQVSSAFDFSQILLDSSSESESLTTPALAPGDYFWRVQATFAGETAAQFSDVSLFTVLSAPLDAAVGVRVQAEALSRRLVVPLFSQHKDTKMLLLEFCGLPDRPTGSEPCRPSRPSRPLHAWNTAHDELDTADPADATNCGLASISMINAWFWSRTGFPNNRLSQDRIGYEVFKDLAPPGPEWDLNYGRGLFDQDIAKALSFALMATPVYHGFAGATQLWNDALQEIGLDRPILAKVGGPTWSHLIVITGYRQTPDGRRFLYVNDPWHSVANGIKAPKVYHLDVSEVSPQLPGAVWKAYWTVPAGVLPRADEESLRTDTDRDGIVDFDEERRFKTDWQKFPDDRDTDKDEVSDLNDIYAAVYDPSTSGYAGRARRVLQIRLPWNLPIQNEVYPLTQFVVRPDVDGDGKMMELDPDSDGGGCYDGFEDYNFDGIPQSAETSNFTRLDDHCHVKGIEVRTENYRLSESVSAKTDWHGDLTAKFCVGPILPARRSDPTVVAGRATIKWTARHSTVYSQLTGSGCQMPLTVLNTYQTTFSPVDNSGSVGSGPARGAITLAFYPRPNAVNVTAQYSESPACAFLEDKPLVWPESSAIWGGAGWFGPPWNRRVTVPPNGFYPAPATFPVPQPGTGQSTLRIWFVSRSEEQAKQPCQP